MLQRLSEQNLISAWKDFLHFHNSQFVLAESGTRHLDLWSLWSQKLWRQWITSYLLENPAHSHSMNLQQTASSFMALLFTPYIKRLCGLWGCFKLLFVKPEHNKILLVSSDPPSQSSVPFEQDTLPEEKESFPNEELWKGSAEPRQELCSQTLGESQGHEGAWGWWGGLWFGFGFGFFLFLSAKLSFHSTGWKVAQSKHYPVVRGTK